jgi:hypothetical protein
MEPAINFRVGRAACSALPPVGIVGIYMIAATRVYGVFPLFVKCAAPFGNRAGKRLGG